MTNTLQFVTTFNLNDTPSGLDDIQRHVEPTTSEGLKCTVGYAYYRGLDNPYIGLVGVCH